MKDLTPAGRLAAISTIYRIYGALCFCEGCGHYQKVTECRQPFRHDSDCVRRNAEPHPWIVINTAIDWAMRTAEPVPAASGPTT